MTAVRVDGVRYRSIALAAEQTGGTYNALSIALRQGRRTYRGHRIAYALHDQLDEAIRLMERRRVMAEWRRRHAGERAPRRREHVIGERLLRPRMLGPGASRGEEAR